MRKKKLIENSTEEDNKTTEAASNTTTNECQYTKTNGGYWTNYGKWSSWTTTKINSSNSRQVQTKVEKVQTGQVTVQVGTTTEKKTPKKLTYSNGAIVYECGSEFDNAGRFTSPRYCIKTVPKYETKPVYKSITYYQYRDRKYVNKTVDYKWSTCDDSKLLNQGYIKTGATK